MSIYSSAPAPHSAQVLSNASSTQKIAEKSALGLVAALCGLHQKHLMNHQFSFKDNK